MFPNSVKTVMLKSPKEFSIFIETFAADNKMTHLESVLKYCEDNYIDPEEISKFISKSLKDKLELDFQRANYLPKKATLEV